MKSPSQDSLKAQPILVTGMHRSGTTWIGKALAAGAQAAYISEPLNIYHRPGVMRTPIKRWYTYICEDNEGMVLPALSETLHLRYHPWLEIKSLRSRKDFLRMGRDWARFQRGRLLRQRPLVKDPFAVFSAPWFARRFDCAVVISVRHPAAVVSSLLRLKWPFQHEDLLAQPLLVRDYLESFRPELEDVVQRYGDVVERGSLLWRVVYTCVAQMAELYPQFIIVRHEDLSRDPVGEFAKLFEILGLEFTPQAEQFVRASSSAENPKEAPLKSIHNVRIDSRAGLTSWKRRLNHDQIERIRRLAEDAAGRYYSDSDWQ